VNVYSTTKGMTALCANQLIERGLLDIEAPVSEYWPEFAAAGKEGITTRWLLSHKAGLCAVRAPLPKNSLYDWDRMCAALAAQEPWWTPGDGHGYHAFTFGFLVGEVVRRITSEGLGTYFRKNVAQPLGADFHIGLAAENDSRTSDIYSVHIGNKPAPTRTRGDPAPSVTGPFAEFARRMQDPTTMQWAALLNPAQDRDSVNTRAWRAAEIPAVNGHGTARALARSDETHRYSRLSPNPRAFGHAGGGGSIGMADPDAGIGFCFTMNNMQASIVSAGATPTVLIDTFYEVLS
jgi:CubicO group peptidase (beta-lactamase class C family)